MFLNGINNAAENRLGVVEGAAATGPLCPLSGKYHRYPSLALIGRGDGRWIFGKAR